MKPGLLRHLLPAMLMFPLIANAHPVFPVYAIFDIHSDTLTAKFELVVTELGQDLEIPPDPNTGRIENAQLLANQSQLYSYVLERIDLKLNYFLVELQPVGHTFSKNQLNERMVHLKFQSTRIGNPQVVSLSADFTNSVYPVFEFLGRLNYGGRYWNLIIEREGRTVQAELNKEGPDWRMQAGAFIRLGIEHIFIGVDHIIFLIGLIVPGGRFLNLVKIVTSFTVAHSITLTLAALNVVNLPSNLIESAIALSIVYIAAENFIIKHADYRWLISGIFGLAHGFGFANVLRGLGLPNKGLVISLFSFNVGVEIGQVIIIALSIPFIWALLRTRWQKQFVWAVSGIILVLGITWFLQRAFNLPVGIL